MSATNAFETAALQHYFQNADHANIGDAAGLQNSTAAGSFYVSLHTADPSETGTQTTSEATYTGYARVAVARSAGGWTVSGNTVSNAAAIDYPVCTGGTNDIFFFGLGSDSTGAGNLFFKGAIGTGLGPFTGATTDTITIPGLSGVAVNDRISFFANDIGSLPTGVTEGTVYFVKTVSGNDITISTTQGGATLDITAAGDGLAFKNTPLSISNNITPSFAIGVLSLTLG